MAVTTVSPLIRFGVAPAVVALALLLRWPLWDYLGGHMPLLFLWPAVVISAWVGGLWAGLLATVLSCIAGGVIFWFAQDTINITGPMVWIGLLSFVALAGLTSLGLERMHEARRELQEQIRKLTIERDWLRAILTASPAGVIVTDDEEKVTLINPTACALTGWSQEQALGKHVNGVFHIISERTRQTIEKPVARVMREGKASGSSSAALLVTPAGLEKRIDEWIAPLRGSEGQIVGAVVSFHDMTQRRPGRDSLPGTVKYFEPSALSQMPAETPLVTIRLRILVVEDNRESADGLATLLSLQGHDVQIAYSGTEAVARAGEWHPQLVLCDINLPGMDGNNVAAALRKNPATSKTRLIAISGSCTEDDRQRALKAGFDHHLTKPIDPQVLQTVIALQTLVRPLDEPVHRGQNSA